MNDKELISANPYVHPIMEYSSGAARIRGFKDMVLCGATVPAPMYILGNDAFHEYLNQGMTDGLRTAIGDVYNAIRASNPTRGAYIGRAFYIPGMDDPNGPRTAGIFDKEEYVKHVESFYSFAIRQNYHTKPGADIALVLHPFINVLDRRPRYGSIEIAENEKLPWTGGYIVPDPIPGQEHGVKIVATFGADEAIQSCPSDTIVVDPDRRIISAKSIAVKTAGLVPMEGEQYEEFPIPLRFQTEQALTDEESLKVADEARKILNDRPESRIEFIMQDDGIYIRQIAPWKPKEHEDRLLLDEGKSITMPVIRVESIEDAAAIPTDKPAVIFFGPGAFRKRTTDVFAHVAHMDRAPNAPLFALIYGTVVTSHMAKILLDAGHSVIHTGDNEYQTGNLITVGRHNTGKSYVEFADPYHNATIRLDSTELLKNGDAGNKIRKLALLKHFGYPIADGFGVRSMAVHQWLHDIGLSQKLEQLDVINIADEQKLEQLTQSIQNTIREKEIPVGFLNQIQHACSEYNFSSYVVRSSGAEDGDGHSLAGLYESHGDIPQGDIPKTFQRVVASYFSPESIIAVRKLGIRPSEMTIGGGVQEYIPPQEGSIGFVIFTYKDKLGIDAVAGSPESLVNGVATDYIHVDIDRHSRTPEITIHGTPSLTITDEQLQSLASDVFGIEHEFRGYQDIEGTIHPKRGTIFFQTRPI